MALMCSELKPQDCHRSKMIGVGLDAEGFIAIHIDENGKPKSQADVMNCIKANQFSLFSGKASTGLTSRKKYTRVDTTTTTTAEVVTLGVYGASENKFFGALAAAGVDTFVDIRSRRGMRGTEYAFVNSQRLQERLKSMGVHYVHVKELAPTDAVRQEQKREDERTGVAKRQRERLGRTFIDAYERDVLAGFDAKSLMRQLPADARIIDRLVLCGKGLNRLSSLIGRRQAGSGLG